MYVCICNNLNSKKVYKAINSGISNSQKIYSFYNCQPKCGKCIELMNCMIEEKSNTKKAV